jgi:putative peptidoglycan lipid II flippase
MGVANLALYSTLCVLLYKPLGVGGVTLATAAVSAANFLGLFVLLRRQIHSVDGRRVAITVAKALVALAPLCVVSWGAWWLLDGWLGRSVPAQLASVGMAYGLGLLAYAVAARLMHMDEIREVVGVVRTRREPPVAGVTTPIDEEDLP